MAGSAKAKGVGYKWRLGMLLCCLLSAGSVAAQQCLIEVSTAEPVGHEFEDRIYTFSELSEIARIVDVDVVDEEYRYDCERICYWWGCRDQCEEDDYRCRENRYRYNDNILTVDNPRNRNQSQCRATFTVEGYQANCEEVIPVSNDVSQVPLFLSQSAEPNVMYILDDSGSMHFELMPDSLILEEARYVFPRADNVYGDGDYNNRVPTVDDSSPYNARARSPQINRIYYNPGVTYRPWIKTDGTHYPNASLTCALHNPERSGTGESHCRNLTANNSNYNDTGWYACTRSDEEEEEAEKGSSDCPDTNDNKSFWPSTYFWYNGGDKWTRSNYTKTEIKLTAISFSGEGREQREDCAARALATCTYAEEIQNFANWYTYYRSRVLAARAGSGFAFASQGSNMRVGFATLNKGESTVDGSNNTSVIVSGVRPFTDEARSSFYTNLYTRDIPNAGTPLRRALDAAGKYFSRDDDRGPWSDTPGEDEGDEEHLECRRNFSVLVSDGYWSGSDASGSAGDNNDGTGGPSHSRTIGSDFTYVAQSPFSDSRDDTLADVAMYYWKNDLRDDLDNLINETESNPAFWQHMVTYSVGFGVSGTIDADTAFAAIDDDDTSISWPDPGSAEVHKIDDMLHAAVNSRGGFFSASEPDVFASELGSVLQEISQQSKASASSIAVNSTRLDSGTLVYQASFNTIDWSGRIQAYTLTQSGAISDIFWDTNSAGKIPAHGLRNIIAGVGGQGQLTTTATAFTVANWGDLTAAQQGFLGLSGDSVDDAKDRLDWLRGDQTREATDFRERDQILGDIVNSDPFYVGSTEDYGYGLLDGTEGTSYAAYLVSKADRDPMLYVGANDGMLHGFDAQTGVEKFAYVPVGVFPRLAQLSEPEYSHRYYVDGSTRANDAYINSAWKTVLVGALGAGGRSVFALDVTAPSSLGSSSLLWEFATADDASDVLGVAMSQPAIARLEAGDKWVAVFGNGYESGDNVKLFVVDLATGSLLKAIDTGVTGEDNALASPVPVDVDGDRITDYVYAGDLQGNLWKFDLKGSSQNNWDVAIKVSGSPQPLFVATDSAGVRQPITSRPTVGRHPGGGYMVYFGTGQYFKTGDTLVPANPQVQDFYGIRDLDATVSRGDLTAQTIIHEGVFTTGNGSDSTNRIRVVSNNSADTPPTSGWRLALVSPSPATANGERVVSSPVLRNGRIIFATIIPEASVCGYGGTSWLMELDAVNGGRVADPALDINGDGKVDYLDVVTIDGVDYPAGGIGVDEMIKTPGIIGAGELEYKYTSGTSGTIGVITETGVGDDPVGRQSWRQLQ